MVFSHAQLALAYICICFETGVNLTFLFKCNLQVELLFSHSKTMGTLVNYSCKSFFKN